MCPLTDRSSHLIFLLHVHWFDKIDAGVVIHTSGLKDCKELPWGAFLDGFLSHV